MKKTDGTIEIVSVEDGSSLFCFLIDAKESVATGRYKYRHEIGEKKQDATIDYSRLNTRSLTELIEGQGIEIDGFEQMSLSEKRESVEKAMKKAV